MSNNHAAETYLHTSDLPIGECLYRMRSLGMTLTSSEHTYAIEYFEGDFYLLDGDSVDKETFMTFLKQDCAQEAEG